MIVYRFERNGIGPYMSRSTAYRITKERMKYRSVKKYTSLQKVQRQTEEHAKNYWKVHKEDQYIYGCTSKEQLRVYFFGDFKILFKQGFRIKRYNVPDSEVVDMGTQVAFPVRYHKLRTIKNIKKRVVFA